MNVHIVIVHFPIAFLSLYSVLELVRFTKITAKPYWFFIKAILVIVGTVSAYAAALSGEAITGSFTSVERLVDMHALWATITVVIFTGIAACYLAAWIERERQGLLGKRAVQLEKMILETPAILFLGAAGLVAITITGALGGAVAFGPDTDPIVKFVYQIFIGT